MSRQPLHRYNTSIYQPARPRPAAPKKRRRLRRAFLFLTTLTVMFVGYHLARNYSSLLDPHHQGSPKASASAPPVLSAAATTQMAAAINKVINNYQDMDVGVAIEDLNNGQFYHYGVSNPFVAASVAKLLTAAMFLHQVETGQQTMDQTLSYGSAAYELQQMIEQSDNTAWADFNGLLTHDGLQAYAGQIGLSNYDPDQNTLTVDDIAILLGKLYKGELLNRADTQLLLSYMHDANYDSYIPASVPAGVKVYHKAGWLDDRVHDAAIIDNGKHPYVLVIFTKDNSGAYDSDEGHQIFAAITGATVKAFL